MNDFAGILSQPDRSELEQMVKAFEQATSNEITIAVINSLEGFDRFTYAHELFSRWKLGKSGKNNGILFLIAISDREAFVEVGKGLEGALPDSLTGTILRKEVFPFFKAGDYATGIKQGVSAIIKATKGEYKADPSRGRRDAGLSGFANFLIFFGFIFFQYFISFLARSKSWWFGGVLGGVGGVLLGWWLFIGIGIAITAITIGAFGLLLDYVVSKNYQQRLREGRPTDFWHSGGGFWFGGRGGGGGFGGFGGGISGGGGAGGRW